jgi:TolA-binding protein
MKKNVRIVIMALVLCFVMTSAYAGDSSSASAAGTATQPNLLMQGSDINLQGGRMLNVSRIFYDSIANANNPATNRDVTSRAYVDAKVVMLQNQITQLQNQIAALSGGGGGGGSTICQPGYVYNHIWDRCEPESNLRR